MKIAEALEPTGMAQGAAKQQYAQIDGGVLYWHRMHGVRVSAVALNLVLRESWHPYHPIGCICGDEECAEVQKEELRTIEVSVSRKARIPVKLNCRECSSFIDGFLPLKTKCNLFLNKDYNLVTIYDMKPCEPCIRARSESLARYQRESARRSYR